MALLALAAAPTGGCASLLESYPGLVMPWEELPERFHWVVSVGPTVNFWNEAPTGADNLFLGVRVGLHFGSAGEHHLSEELIEESLLAWWASHTYFRFGFPFLPDNLFVSPLGEATGLNAYGVGLRPTSFGTHDFGHVLRGAVSVGVVVTYLYLKTLGPAASETHFLRPGFDVRADLEVDWGASWFVGIGWNSLFHLPQRLGTNFDDARDGGTRLWHLGQAYLLFNFRLSDDGAPRLGPED